MDQKLCRCHFMMKASAIIKKLNKKNQHVFVKYEVVTEEQK